MRTPVLFPELVIERGALLSPCGWYRYALWRIWNKQLPTLGFILLNPSTADAVIDDPTIARCCERARLLGFGGIYVVNLFAVRATNPEDIYTAPNPVGPDNDRWIRYYMTMCHKVVCGWGKHGSYCGRAKEVLALFADLQKHFELLYALNINADGTPTHPLYLSYQATLMPYSAREALAQ